MLNIPLRVRNLVNRLATCNPDEIAKDLRIKVIYGETPNGVNGFGVKSYAENTYASMKNYPAGNAKWY